MDVLVSVIIPVYNAECYIEECIKSLINQTLDKCEFIFINDGSQDTSKEIIENYKKVDKRIKIINQKNQGVSIARNEGIKLAQGTYIGFVDADDYIELDMYEKLYNSSKNGAFDLILSKWKHEIDGKKITEGYTFPINRELDKEFIDNNIIPHFIKLDNLNTVCNKIYKHKIISDNRITFPKDVALGEDGIFNTKFFNKAQKIKYIDYAGYNYREVIGSATRNIKNKDYFKRSLDVYKFNIKDICDIKIDNKEIDKLKSIKLINSVISYIYIYYTAKEINFKYKYFYIRNMIKNKYVQQSLPIYINEKYNEIGRYEKYIVKMISNKSSIGLYLITKYSELRNR